MKLFHSYDTKIECSYIIRIKGHSLSETLADRCRQSCERIGQPVDFWDATDGTSELTNPHDDAVLRIVKITNNFLSRSEVACFLSHLSLWSHCAQIDKPIVILEHDAIFIKPYLQHTLYNSISYLGCFEQAKQGWTVQPTPPHGSEGPGHHFILRAHAYSIDPAIARNLVAHTIRFGILESTDKFIRSDIFPVHQMGLFAYDESYTSTITNKHSDDKMLERRNDMLLK